MDHIFNSYVGDSPYFQGDYVNLSILKISLGLKYFLLAFLNGPLINFFQILLKANFFLNPIGRFFLITKDNSNLILKQLFLICPIDLCLYFGPDIQQLKSIFHRNFIIVRTTEHQKLCKMEKVFGLGCSFVNSTLFVHINELFYTYLFVEFLVELPDHTIDLCIAHLYTHF